MVKLTGTYWGGRYTGQYTLVGCDLNGGTAPPVSTGQLYHYSLGVGCPSPTPGITPSPTPTSTATATATTPPATASPSPGCVNYTISNSSGSIVPGTTDIGNHTDDGANVIALPFAVNLYGNTYTMASAGSNGFLSFGSFINSFYSGCLPNTSFSYTIFPFETDQNTTPAGMGIFTLTTGTAPNRSFYVEWRNCHYASSTTCLASTNANYEIVFQEGNPDFSIVYGVFDSGNSTYGAIGVQGSSLQTTQSQCALGAPSSTKQIYTLCVTGTPSPTPTATATATATATTPVTPTPSGSPCNSYTYTVSTGSIVPGTTDTGNHDDDNSTAIVLPFAYNLYDQQFTTVRAGSNGHLTFGTFTDSFNASCLPQAITTYAIFPYRTDLCTGPCGSNTGTNLGIFTSVSGSAPNRIFNIEWRTAYYSTGQT